LVIQNKGQTPTYARGSSEGVSGAGMFTPKPEENQKTSVEKQIEPCGKEIL
jgi:hypothetical protein